jgi:aminoglycoside phosphotransferase (APT) family kinase protein
MALPARRLDHKALADLLREVWPDVQLRELSIEKIHTGRSSDHYRVHHRERSMILRSAPQGEGVARHLGALTALVDEPFVPALYGDVETGGKRHLIAMQDMGGQPLIASDVEQHASDLVEIVRSVHENEAFREAVAVVELRDVARDEPSEDFDASLDHVREIAPGDERLARAERWLDAERRLPDTTDLINSVMVPGHGDLQRSNWLLTSGGLVLIDWEDVGLTPLAHELARVTVSGHLASRSVAELYGVAPKYVEAVERSTAQHALYLYVSWLRMLLEEENVDTDDLAYAEALCESAFA